MILTYDYFQHRKMMMGFDTRKMFEIFDDPKGLLFYQGDAHGTELFDKERESIIEKLQGFIAAAFGTCD